jgi:hypothetical protein
MVSVPLGARHRRRHARRAVHIVALLHCHGLHRTVAIVDYSQGGLRMKNTFGVAVGEKVTVELCSGHRLPVVVRWAVGGQIGVQFVGVVPAGHPAMLALDEAAERYRRLHPAAFPPLSNPTELAN